MSEIVQTTVVISSQDDIILARSAGRNLARSLGFGTVDQSRIATSISELTRNALLHAKGGICTLSAFTENGKPAIRIAVSDQGPGKAGVDVAQQPGLPMGISQGQGLAAVRRLMGNLRIDSVPGRTIAEAVMCRRD